MNDDVLEDYKASCYKAQVPSDDGYAIALVAQSISKLADSVDELRKTVKEGLDDLIIEFRETR